MASIFEDNNQVAYYELRKKRNELLKETDFYALSDVTLSSSMRTYRQALRDLPSNTPNPQWDGETSTLLNVTFPTKPSE